ncbi:ABC transporter substrate-binding protein [Pseudaminobacter sp. NGMCC 1.201702]|uniref:ABC transporter substrate-binding protein n=1 Tax=Pseudaminobacter sp. NGMCC 1.201702 TaxID=3391825 RepID=UPI0039EE897B
MKRRLTALVVSAAILMPSVLSAAPKAELILAIGGEPEQGLDPVMGWGEYGGNTLFQSTLLSRDADFQTVPDLAKSWTRSDDGLSWTVIIRDDANFSDGSPLTAEDVAFTYRRSALSGGTRDLTVLAGAEALDDTTVVLTLKEPRVTFLDSFYNLGIVPAASYGKGYGSRPIGSGPYKLLSWTPGEQLIAEANPYYYGAELEFKRIVFLFTDEDTSMAAAAAGQIDVVAAPAQSAERVPSGMKAVIAESVDNRGLAFPMLPGGRVTEDGNPLGNDITSDPAIRQAINVGIDRNMIVDVALMGHGRPAYSSADGLPWSHADSSLPDASPDQANVILDEAGWAMGANGIRANDGVEARLPIYYPASDSTRQAIAVTLAELLRPLGLAAEPIGKSWDDIRKLVHSQLIVLGWGSHNPRELYSLYSGTNAGKGWFNTGWYSNEKVEAHFAAAEASLSLESSFPHWQRAAWDGATGFSMRGDAAWVWLVNLDHVYFVNECIDVGRTQIEPHGHGWPITTNIAHWRWVCE